MDKADIIWSVCRKFFVVTVLMLILLVTANSLFNSISKRNINEGEIVSKDFTPAHSETRFVPVVTSNGKITSSVLIPYLYYYPDTYKITIKNMNTDDQEVTESYRVIKDVYDVVNVGDYFIYDKDFEPDEPEYIKYRQNVEQKD